jgi:hypothetical protein
MRGYYYLLPLTVKEWQTTTIVAATLRKPVAALFTAGQAVPGDGLPQSRSYLMSTKAGTRQPVLLAYCASHSR